MFNTILKRKDIVSGNTIHVPGLQMLRERILSTAAYDKVGEKFYKIDSAIRSRKINEITAEQVHAFIDDLEQRESTMKTLQFAKSGYYFSKSLLEDAVKGDPASMLLGIDKDGEFFIFNFFGDEEMINTKNNDCVIVAPGSARFAQHCVDNTVREEVSRFLKISPLVKEAKDGKEVMLLVMDHCKKLQGFQEEIERYYDKCKQWEERDAGKPSTRY